MALSASPFALDTKRTRNAALGTRTVVQQQLGEVGDIHVRQVEEASGGDQGLGQKKAQDAPARWIHYLKVCMSALYLGLTLT